MRCLGTRGATTVSSNTRRAILNGTKELLQKMVVANDVKVVDIASIFFTTTRDLNAEFPALGARELGWNHTALLCGHEMEVPGSVPKCIRVLMLVNTDQAPEDLAYVYLRGAKNLRNLGVSSQPSKPKRRKAVS